MLAVAASVPAFSSRAVILPILSEPFASELLGAATHRLDVLNSHSANLQLQWDVRGTQVYDSKCACPDLITTAIPSSVGSRNELPFSVRWASRLTEGRSRLLL